MVLKLFCYSKQFVCNHEMSKLLAKMGRKLLQSEYILSLTQASCIKKKNYIYIQYIYVYIYIYIYIYIYNAFAC